MQLRNSGENIVLLQRIVFVIFVNFVRNSGGQSRAKKRAELKTQVPNMFLAFPGFHKKIGARGLVVSDLGSETTGSRFESGCWLCAEVSSLQ